MRMFYLFIFLFGFYIEPYLLYWFDKISYQSPTILLCNLALHIIVPLHRHLQRSHSSGFFVSLRLKKSVELFYCLKLEVCCVIDSSTFDLQCIAATMWENKAVFRGF